MLLNKKISKCLASMLALVMCIFVFSGCIEPPKPKTTVKVWSAVNTKKILQDDEEASDAGDEGKLVFNTFKGDVEAAQLFFTPEKDVASFSFEMCDVTNSNGDKLEASLFEVYAQRYIEVSIPSSIHGKVGWNPDALIPLRNYTLKKENKVAAGNNQGLWVNLNVPTDANPGTYTGTATLTVDDNSIKIPVSVSVYNIQMPEQIHSTASYYLEMGQIGNDTSIANTDELVKTYYDFFVKKRANLRDIPGYTINRVYDSAKYAEDVVDYVRNPMVSAYALPYKGNSSGIVDYEYCYDTLYHLAIKNKELLDKGEEIDLFAKAHYYLGSLIDEPTPTSYDKVRACDYNIHRAKLAVAATGILDDYPSVKESLLSLRHVVTAQINPALYGTDEVGGIQTWCPLITNFSTESQRKLAQDRINSSDRTGGEDVWWYSCINPTNPYSSYQTDESLLAARVKAWMEYDYNVHGFLYWSVNNWRRYYQGDYMVTDIWTDPLGWESANGDGRLVYPGVKYGVKGPISTIRLENIRESYEDYEILWLFEQTVNSINSTHSKTYDASKILNNYYDRIYKDMFVNKNVTEEDFENIRLELIVLLEMMINDTTTALSALDELNK